MRIVPLSAFKDNYIWALVDSRQALVVDPGEAAPVRHFLSSADLTLAGVLLTHHHADHIGGVSDLLASHDVPVFGPRDFRMPMVSHHVAEGAAFAVPGFPAEFQVLAVPGHTESHIAYLGDKTLWCGDTLFSGGCGRLLGGTAPQLFASLSRLAELADDTAIYCAHEYTLSNLRFALAVEPHNRVIQERLRKCEVARERGEPTVPSQVGDELEFNPFLRCRLPQVRAAAEAHSGRELATPLDVFTTLRQWKDGF